MSMWRAAFRACGSVGFAVLVSAAGGIAVAQSAPIDAAAAYPALTGVMGGHIALSTGNLPGGPLAAIKAGKVTGLGVTTAKRNPRAPEIPTFAEGGVAGYEVAAWYGICAPAGVPAGIVAKLNAGLVKVLSSPDLQRRMGEQGIDVTPSTPAQFAAHIKAESAKWAKVVKSAGLAEK